MRLINSNSGNLSAIYLVWKSKHDRSGCHGMKYLHLFQITSGWNTTRFDQSPFRNFLACIIKWRIKSQVLKRNQKFHILKADLTASAELLTWRTVSNWTANTGWRVRRWRMKQNQCCTDQYHSNRQHIQQRARFPWLLCTHLLIRYKLLWWNKHVQSIPRHCFCYRLFHTCHNWTDRLFPGHSCFHS